MPCKPSILSPPRASSTRAPSSSTPRRRTSSARERVPGRAPAAVPLGDCPRGQAKAVIFHCRSARGCWRMRRASPPRTDCQAYILDGGIDAWKKAGSRSRPTAASRSKSCAKSRSQPARWSCWASFSVSGSRRAFFALSAFVGAASFCRYKRLVWHGQAAGIDALEPPRPEEPVGGLMVRRSTCRPGGRVGRPDRSRAGINRRWGIDPRRAAAGLRGGRRFAPYCNRHGRLAVAVNAAAGLALHARRRQHPLAVCRRVQRGWRGRCAGRRGAWQGHGRPETADTVRPGNDLGRQ